MNGSAAQFTSPNLESVPGDGIEKEERAVFDWPRRMALV